MPEMMGLVLLIEASSKIVRKPHEFEDVLNRNRRSGGIAGAIRRLRQRWIG